MKRFPVTALRSAELETPDLELSVSFYTQVWGLACVSRTETAAYLRASGDDAYVLALHAGPKTALRSVTFRCAVPADLGQIAEAAAAQGCAVTAPADSQEPGGGVLLSLREPQGGTLRFVHGDRRNADAAVAPNRPIRLAHVNINSVAVDEAAAFYQAVLGFGLTDRSKLMAFLRCNADHHAVVLAEAPVNGLNHVAFLMPDLESVMRGAGRMVDHGYSIGWGVGRHGPGDNVFAYFVDPVGTVIEYTAEVLQVDDDYVVRGPKDWVWPPGRTDHWGIAPPKSDHVKAAQIAVLHAASEASR
ncbi:VOC family protein [Alsobacter sp. KACC 23698]|uniref:VOC family protein n=1 Tax=Alsobacter sp. KACC 23698 TaxID=3149229 RepID=A0AAU7JLH7_9HYPH